MIYFRYKRLFKEENIKSVSDALKFFGFDSLPNKETINKTYKDLSKKHHPDLGGSQEDMQSLNQAKDILDKQITKNPNGKSDEELKQDWKAHYEKTKKENIKKHEIIKNIFYEYFKPENLINYLNNFYKGSLNYTIETNESKKNYIEQYGVFYADIKIFNEDNTTVFYLRYYIDSNRRESSGLGHSDIDENDLLYDFSISTNIYHNKRKIKLSIREYKSNVGLNALKNYEEVFPKDKLKKIFSNNVVKKAFKKADMLLGLQRELNVTLDKDIIFIYPFGKEKKTYINLQRGTFRNIAYYNLSSVWYIDSDIRKYKNGRLPYYVTLEESEQSLINIISFVKEIKNKCSNLINDEFSNGNKIYDIIVDSYKKLFPKEEI